MPQVSVNDSYMTLPTQGNAARGTTTTTFKDGDKPVIFFLIAFPGDNVRIDINYTVGDGESGEDIGSGLENTVVTNKSVKVMENGMLYIIKNGVRYNALGEQVR